MNFKAGQIVWVESSQISTDLPSEYWPAIFIQKTNIEPLCMVNFYSSKNFEGPKNFLVNIQKISRFELYQIANSFENQDFKNVYEAAQKDNKSFQEKEEVSSIEKKQIQVESSSEFCFAVEDMYRRVMINDLKEITVFKNSEIPVKDGDLQIYFSRKTTQLLSYFIEKFNFENCPETKQKFIKWHTEIVQKFLTALERKDFDLIPMI